MHAAKIGGPCGTRSSVSRELREGAVSASGDCEVFRPDGKPSESPLEIGVSGSYLRLARVWCKTANCETLELQAWLLARLRQSQTVRAKVVEQTFFFDLCSYRIWEMSLSD